jgi:signal transduction histidine kinase/CheY-like chemotaxis protein
VGSARDHCGALASGRGQARGDLDPSSAIQAGGAALSEFSAASVRPLSPSLGTYAIELFGIGVTYFVLAKVGLALASIHPSASPIWPPTGLALAAVVVRGYRVWPAIFLGALVANATTAGSIYTSSAIALGNTLEALVGGYLISRWSGGLRVFDTPAGVARFALIALAATPISATIGIGSLTLAGYADSAHLASTWVTWWLGDLAGALVITPVIVLWARSSLRRKAGKEFLEAATVLALAILIGVLAFSPFIEQTPSRDALGFLAVLPLMWAALRCGQRDTATVALVLSGFAVWGTLAGAGPFAGSTLNDAFLLLLMYMISTSVPTLALSANASLHRRTERSLREAHAELGKTVQARTTELEQTREALHQVQKMEALGQLTGGIAHDFNNILTVIINSLQSVRGSLDEDSKTRERLDRAMEAAHNGASLVQQLLVFARRHPLQVRPTDLNRIVSSAVAMFSRSCPESIAISTDLAPDLRWATADATQVQTAILNLALNARDAMPSGGRLTVATRNVSDGMPLPADLPPGDYISITVTDTGGGMSPDVLARVFEPFFTTKEIGKGTGLGLSMVYSTMQQMGGDIAIESPHGEGTSVRLLLPAAPLARSGTAMQPEAIPAATPRDAAPIPVLYVEDDALVSRATVDILESAGYLIHAVRDGRRALEVVQAHPEIGLMVTDIGLPGMDGHELAVEARRRQPRLKVLFLTGYDRTRALGQPEDPLTKYLSKPYREPELLETLRRLCSAK